MASSALTAVSRKEGDASAPRIRKGGFIHGHGLWLLILPAFGALTGGLDAHHPEIVRAVGRRAEALVALNGKLLRFPIAA